MRLHHHHLHLMYAPPACMYMRRCDPSPKAKLATGTRETGAGYDPVDGHQTRAGRDCALWRRGRAAQRSDRRVPPSPGELMSHARQRVLYMYCTVVWGSHISDQPEEVQYNIQTTDILATPYHGAGMCFAKNNVSL